MEIIYKPEFSGLFYFLAILVLGDFMKEKSKKALLYLGGAITGAVNGMLGSGGGMIAVPLLKKSGLNQKQAQANAIAVILPISILSAAIYTLRGNMKIADAFPYIPGGIIGTAIGTFCLSKISSVWLKRIFGAFMVYAGIRLLLR